MLFHHNLLNHFVVLGQMDIIPHLDKVQEDHTNIYRKLLHTSNKINSF